MNSSPIFYSVAYILETAFPHGGEGGYAEKGNVKKGKSKDKVTLKFKGNMFRKGQK